MKALRNIFYVIIAIFLGIFINVLSLTLILKDVVQDEIITNSIKTSLVTGYLTKNIGDIDKLTPQQKSMLEEFLNDNEINEIVNVLIDDYINYQSDSSYKISQNDVDKLKNYVIKHQNLIKEVSSEDVDINEIIKEITVDNIDKSAKKVSEQLEDLPAELKPVISSYKYIIDGPVKVILISLIIICIILMMLISWSLVKWMRATGICLITNGVLISLSYLFVEGFKNILLKAANISISFNNMSFNNILIIGILELIVGILFVVGFVLLNKKTKLNDANESNDVEKEKIDNNTNNEEEIQ